MFRVSTALCGLARGRRLTVNIDVECGGPIADKSAPTVALCTPSNVGAGLPAMGSSHSTSMLTVRRLPRASPHRATAIRNIYFHIPFRDFRCSYVLFRCSRSRRQKPRPDFSWSATLGSPQQRSSHRNKTFNHVEEIPLKTLVSGP